MQVLKKLTHLWTTTHQEKYQCLCSNAHKFTIRITEEISCLSNGDVSVNQTKIIPSKLSANK
jgi:hypothetical protein